ENIARVNGLVLRIVAWITVPIAAAFAILAQPVIQTIYGAKWDAAIPLLPFSMVWGFFASLAVVTDSLLLARQQQKRCLIVDVLVLTGTATLLVLVLPHGAKIYLAGMVGLYFGINCLSLFWLTRLKAMSGSGILAAIIPPVFCSL